MYTFGPMILNVVIWLGNNNLGLCQQTENQEYRRQGEGCTCIKCFLITDGLALAKCKYKQPIIPGAAKQRYLLITKSQIPKGQTTLPRGQNLTKTVTKKKYRRD